jgi:hypothetical protein
MRLCERLLPEVARQVSEGYGRTARTIYARFDVQRLAAKSSVDRPALFDAYWRRRSGDDAMSEPLRNIGQIHSPLARVAAWVLLREDLRRRKEVGEIWPWAVCPLLSCGSRFTNVRREDDTTSRWCAANVRAPYAGTPELLPAVVYSSCSISSKPG